MTRVRRIICSECGVMVENPHRNQKYCPDCRIKVAREQRAISHRREREKKKKQREELAERMGVTVSTVTASWSRFWRGLAKSTRYAMVFIDEED